MKLLADENVKGRLVRWLRESGHDVIVGPKGLKNSKLVALAESEGRALLTNDTDFLNTALYPPAGSRGRIVLRVFPPTLSEQRAALSRLFSELTAEKIVGKTVELTRDTFELHTT